MYCDWLQLDLFDTGLSQYSEQDFTQAGLTARDRELVQFLRGEILGHATMLTNIIGRTAPTRCSYRYPFTTFWEFIDFTQKISKVTESLAYGFAPHLDARATAQLVLQAVAVTGRQQMIFRQFEGLFPVPIWFTTSIPQSWAWTLIAPYINYCPGNNPRLVWQNYPALNVDTQPSPFTLNGTVVATNATGGTTNTTLGPSINAANVSAIPPAQICQNSTCAPAIVSNRTEQLSRPGQMVKLTWEKPGMLVGPNNSYITHTAARTPRWVAWVTQLNITYTPITGADGSNSSTGETTQPDFHTYAGDPAVNGTMYVAITDENLFVTPFNLSMLNPHIVAGPAVYQAG